ncbi:MAG: PQQ-binding-like beta-propeller repeat protein, partial [Acidobacteriota bacterium]
WRKFKVAMPYFGHASSPIRYGASLIVLAGGAMAFDLESGDLLWDNWDFEASYASPRVVRVAGRDQIVAPVAGEILGLDPASGKILWRQEHANQYKTILSSPLVLDDDRVFVSSAWVGSRSLRLGGDAERGVTELWHNPKMQISYSNAVRVGDWIYASSGVEVDFLTSIHVETGEIGWKQRGLAQTNLLRIGDRFLLLDEDGQLVLATLTPEQAIIHHKVQLFDSRSWTVPTLVGTRLYARNEKKILALELGKPEPVRTSAD